MDINVLVISRGAQIFVGFDDTGPKDQTKNKMWWQLGVATVAAGVLGWWKWRRTRREKKQPSTETTTPLAVRHGPYECRTFPCLEGEYARVLLSDLPVGEEDIRVSTRFSTYWRAAGVRHPNLLQGPALVAMTNRAVSALVSQMTSDTSPIHAVGNSCAILVEALKQTPVVAPREFHFSLVEQTSHETAWMHTLAARLEAGDVRVFLHLFELPNSQTCRLLGSCPVLSMHLHQTLDSFYAGDVCGSGVERLF